MASSKLQRELIAAILDWRDRKGFSNADAAERLNCHHTLLGKQKIQSLSLSRLMEMLAMTDYRFTYRIQRRMARRKERVRT